MPSQRSNLRQELERADFLEAFGGFADGDAPPDDPAAAAAAQRGHVAGSSLRASAVDRAVAAEAVGLLLDGAGEAGAGGAAAPPRVAAASAAATANNAAAVAAHRPLGAAAVARRRQPRAANPSLTLQAIRARMTPEGMLESSRSKSAFTRHQHENELLILDMFEHTPEVLHEDFRNQLHDTEATIDYSDITDRPRNRPYRGKLTVDERKSDLRIKQMRERISDALGPPGQRPPEQTVDFEKFLADPTIYAMYLSRKRKPGDALMKARVYGGYRSSLTYLFKRYRVLPSEQYLLDVKDYLDGIQRIATDANQNGEVRTQYIVHESDPDEYCGRVLSGLFESILI